MLCSSYIQRLDTYRMGIIKGVSAYNFEPKKEATREQAAAVLLRTYDRLHAAIKVTEAADGSAPSGCVTAGSITEESGSVPVSPRAPMEEVYAAAVRAGEGGSVALRAVPLLQVTRAGAVTDTRELTEGELIELLSEGTLRTHRSAQHESSCGYRTEKDGSVTVVWYESETDIAEKTELCRLLGIGGTLHCFAHCPAGYCACKNAPRASGRPDRGPVFYRQRPCAGAASSQHCVFILPHAHSKPGPVYRLCLPGGGRV